jgi:phenylacetate-CoA ligase
MAEYAERLIGFKTAILTSYPSPLEYLAKYCLRKKIRIRSLRAIICSAEQLYDHQRHLFEEAFSVPVFDRYGCREFGDIAMECEKHNGLHIMSNRVLLETVQADGSQCAVGEPGEIVVTDLDNYAMPFVRYKIGDMGSVTDRQCECGRRLPLLERLEGRVFELVRTPSGNTISGTFWTLLTRHISQEIKAFQVVQDRLDSITILLQMAHKQLALEEENALLRKIREVAPDLQVSIKYVRYIPLTRSGKRRFVLGMAGEQVWQTGEG